MAGSRATSDLGMCCLTSGTESPGTHELRDENRSVSSMKPEYDADGKLVRILISVRDDRSFLDLLARIATEQDAAIRHTRSEAVAES